MFTSDEQISPPSLVLKLQKNSVDAVRRLGTIIQSIFCAQSGATIHLTVWKWSGECRYPGALPLVLGNVRRAFPPDPRLTAPGSPKMIKF